MHYRQYGRRKNDKPLLERMLPYLLVLVLAALAFYVKNSLAADVIPERAHKYAPIVVDKLNIVWPDMSAKEKILGKIEQETCITVKHKFCWNPFAELKTSREYGFGLGQLTIACNPVEGQICGPDGKVRFNVFEEVKTLDVTLKSWKWEDRFNPDFQIHALILKNKVTCKQMQNYGLADDFNVYAACFSAYNGGKAGVLKDQILCRNTKDCDPTRWYPVKTKLAIKDVSTKSRVKMKGYGQSPYDINRGYVDNIMLPGKRSDKYKVFLKPKQTEVKSNGMETVVLGDKEISLGSNP